jgi:hypothetical protein
MTTGKTRWIRSRPHVVGSLLTVALMVGSWLALPSAAFSAGGSLAISTTPALTPAFSTSIPNYTAKCGTSTTDPSQVTVSVSAPAGTTVSVDGTPARSGAFSVAVSRAWGQGFAFTVTAGNASPAVYHVRCLPSEFPAFNIERPGPAQAQYYIVAVASPPPLVSYVAIVDTNGVPVWWYKSPSNLRPVYATLLGNGNMAWTNASPSNLQGSINSEERTLTGQPAERHPRRAAPAQRQLHAGRLSDLAGRGSVVDRRRGQHLHHRR